MTPKNKARTLLIDADIFAYAASAVSEKVYYWDGPGSEPSVDTEETPESAGRLAIERIEKIANQLKASRIVVCLTDAHNFRKDVWPQYKANRKDVRRPTHLIGVKDALASKYETYKRPGLEADDCMGILATHKTLIPGEKVIVSSDKDLKTIPGLLFNPDRDRVPHRITKVAADRNFLQQVITGDATDGYPGCPGVGPKSKFVGLIHTCTTLSEMWRHVLDAYASKGLTATDAVLQARMARILRATDWDFKLKAPRLWSPPI